MADIFYRSKKNTKIKEIYLGKINGEYKLHRKDGPAVECADGTKSWCLNGKPHREDGPAIEYADGTKWWCLNGKQHREDGPAVEYADGTKFWFLNGKELTEKEWIIQIKFNFQKIIIR